MSREIKEIVTSEDWALPAFRQKTLRAARKRCRKERICVLITVKDKFGAIVYARIDGRYWLFDQFTGNDRPPPDLQDVLRRKREQERVETLISQPDPF